MHINIISASYIADVYFNVPNAIYSLNERIELKGWVYLTNLSDGNESFPLSSADVNISIKNSSGNCINSYIFTTDSNGTFYSKSNFFPSASEINASSVSGIYTIRAEYLDPANNSWFSEVSINVIDQIIDSLRVSSEKAVYDALETIKVEAEAIRFIGENIFYVSNVSINGSLRNSSKDVITNFNCTTGINGKCNVYLTAPSSYGDYILELDNFKTYNSFSVIPFSYNLYMKDELGKSLKNTYAIGEQANVEVKISNASSSDEYYFSGYISNSSGSIIKTITSTLLNSNNSFTNSFLFTVDSLTFKYGAYGVFLNVSKVSGGSINSITSFRVEDWTITVKKKTVNSGFEYDYNTFINKTLMFEILPTYRSNGSVLTNLSSSYFNIDLKDSLNNIIVSSNNTLWNSSCGANGCYEFSFLAPLNPGKYTLYTSLSNGGSIQTDSKVVNVVSSVMSGQSTDKDGNIKELFGTNEFAYISLSAYNLSTSNFNVSDAEVFIVRYMNGSEFTYTQANDFDSVNSTNSDYEWAFNSSLQRLKLDVPKVGGVYEVFIFSDNRTIGSVVKFIVNPYDICSAAKNTPGTVSSGYYYVWQFKTSDTIYFELKLTQANNPLGKASAINVSSNSTGNGSIYGLGSACLADSTKQVVGNATITIIEVKNLESGSIEDINTTESKCQSSGTSGTYSCTVMPLSKWEGGQNIVKFKIENDDGTSSVAYSRFEARAFYLYGYTSTYQNNPSSNLSLSVRIYEAGNNWWGGYGSSGGLSGTVTLKKIEYQGKDGEWLSPPIDFGYNVSLVNSSAITTGAGTLNIPVINAPEGIWKSGNYRVVLQATTSSGESDYGYAYFSVKLWDVYGSPIDCNSNLCNYKSYFNSKENISLYIRITKAGNYNDYGNQNIWGNTSIKVKKIQDCRKWPCKDLNSSQYTSNTIYVNSSSPWYYNTNASSAANYILQINNTAGSWGSGNYNVILDVNGSDNGYAWFNTIAFYAETLPVNLSGAYKYNIRGNTSMYFNISTTKSYKWLNSYWNGSTYVYNQYNSSDYVNVTFDDAVLRTWDSFSSQTKEYNYPEDINVSPLSINGTGVLNFTYLNGSWPSGYYWGEVSLKNADNEISTAGLWFNSQAFRVGVNSVGNIYNIGIENCFNVSLNVYDPDWNLNSLIYGNYSITNIYEDIYTGYQNSRVIYTNYTNVSFNATKNITLCPNNGSWGSGSWGGYHYVVISLKDNSDNSTQTGGLSFRSIPFQVSIAGLGGNGISNQPMSVLVSITNPVTGANSSGNLSKLYQWRYDNGISLKEEYVFRVGNCYSNVSSKCTVNGSNVNVTIYPGTNGWKIGYNYLQSDWTSTTDPNLVVQDSSIYFEGRSAYNGYFSNSDINGNFKYYFTPSENLTIKLYVRDSNYTSAGTVSITKVEYAYSDNCWDENCRTYTSAIYSPSSTNAQGYAVLNIKNIGAWTKGTYAIRATVGGANIIGGTVYVKNLTLANITVASPIINTTYNNSFYFNVTTNKDSQCNIRIDDYNSFYNYNCNGMSPSNMSSQSWDSCNYSKYNFNSTAYLINFITSDYYSIDYGPSNYTYYSRPTGLYTGGRYHYYLINSSTLINNQSYGIEIWCNDNDGNWANERVAFKFRR